MPVVLPHRLLPWLVRSRVFPEIAEDEVKQFWQHLRDVGCSYARTSSEPLAHPCWLWGDDCVYNELGQKLVVVCMGAILDTRTLSWECCWPLFVYRADPWQPKIASLINHKSRATQCPRLTVGLGMQCGVSYTASVFAACPFTACSDHLHPAPSCIVTPASQGCRIVEAAELRGPNWTRRRR